MSVLTPPAESKGKAVGLIRKGALWQDLSQITRYTVRWKLESIHNLAICKP